MEGFRWTSPIDPGEIAEVVNHYGNIRFRSSDDGTLELSATIQKLGPNPGQVRIETHKHTGRVIIRVGPLSDPGIPPSWFCGRVDVTVLLPPNVSAHARTLDGLIEVKGVTGDVTASSINGDIKVVLPGHVQAKTRHGRIEVLLGDKIYEKPLSLTSVDGDITVKTVQNISLLIEASTGGVLLATFPKHGAGAVKRGKNTLRATLGRATGTLNVSSESGRIELIGVDR